MHMLTENRSRGKTEL